MKCATGGAPESENIAARELLDGCAVRPCDTQCFSSCPPSLLRPFDELRSDQDSAHRECANDFGQRSVMIKIWMRDDDCVEPLDAECSQGGHDELRSNCGSAKTSTIEHDRTIVASDQIARSISHIEHVNAHPPVATIVHSPKSRSRSLRSRKGCTRTDDTQDHLCVHHRHPRHR